MTKLQIVGAASAVILTLSIGAYTSPALAKAHASTSKIAVAIKADVAQLIADFNNHDATKATSQDAPDVVAMFHGAPNVVGAAADLASNQKGFAADPTQHVSVANETVDVAASGEMAVYRSTYVFNGTDSKTKKAFTENGNYLAGFKKQPDGSWKIAWSVVSNTAAP
jgi:ketosteroid isomerase-like protein